MKTIGSTYWSPVLAVVRTLSTGLRITFKHLIKARSSNKNFTIAQKGYFEKRDGINTVQYPHISIPVPDNGRYKLHNEIDDCIVCDKCAKVCPVDCITIEPIRSPEEFGKTSDGSPKRIYAAKFEIDMGKCCFCGLCTTVCPTECLTMTKEYDFSVFNIVEHNFEFANMTPDEISEKQNAFDIWQAQKNIARENPAAQEPASKTIKPAFKPKIKPTGGDGNS